MLGLEPLVLEAKEGLSLVNGTPCVTGLAALALARAERLLDWTDVVAAMSFENLRGQLAAFDAESLALRISPGLTLVGRRLRAVLEDSGILAASAGQRTQDPLSMRTIRMCMAPCATPYATTAPVNRELASVSDNPAVTGTPEAPQVYSEAHAVAPHIALAMDRPGSPSPNSPPWRNGASTACSTRMSPACPPSWPPGVASGFMIAQYTAASLVAYNRRLASPASLDGGITSGLQEDHLTHATPAALKARDPRQCRPSWPSNSWPMPRPMTCRRATARAPDRGLLATSAAPCRPIATTAPWRGISPWRFV